VADDAIADLRRQLLVPLRLVPNPIGLLGAANANYFFAS
jgi:hypothetical protein